MKKLVSKTLISIILVMVCGLLQTSRAQITNFSAITKVALSLNVAGSWVGDTTASICTNGGEIIYNSTTAKDTLSGVVSNGPCQEFTLTCTNGTEVQFVASLTRDIRSNDWRGYHSGKWALECISIITNITWKTNLYVCGTNFTYTYKTNHVGTNTVIITKTNMVHVYCTNEVETVKYKTNVDTLASGKMDGTCGSGTHRVPLVDCELCSDCAHFEGYLNGAIKKTATTPAYPIFATYAGDFVIPGTTNPIPCNTLTAPPVGPVLMNIEGMVDMPCSP